MDLFDDRAASPMLIAKQAEAFDDPGCIYELKLDGFRCLVYCDKKTVDLRNKKNMRMLPKFPELSDIYRNIADRCILDGEIVVLKNGVPDFFALQKRTLLTDPFRIQVEAALAPASFVAFDCIYRRDKEQIWYPLYERKRVLSQIVSENDRIAVSRYISDSGVALYHAAEQKKLEGIVAKRKDSVYYMGKRSSDWIKCKRMADEEFIIAGYLQKGKHIFSLILAKYMKNFLIYKGHVTAGVTRDIIEKLTITDRSPFPIFPVGHEKAVWVKPDYVCVVEYMPNTLNSLRQPVFKGFRLDVLPEEVAAE